MPHTPEQKNFRDAMSYMASAVSVVTTNGSAGRGGITATAVCSITDTPPTVLVCVNQSGKMNPVFKENKTICINMLNADQQDVADHFSGATNVEMQERFKLNNWREGIYTLPVLEGALRNLEGKISKIEEIGTHSLFFVELEQITSSPKNTALIYFNREYRSL